jgi:AcrR family transcriptional regulator
MESAESIAGPEGKLTYILKAAQLRLGLFGYEKTTMQEIADDIAMSKASLYYYFPDKESLFKAVIENEQKEYFILLEKRIAELTEPDEMISELVEMRHLLFRKFLNLSKFRLSEKHKIKPLLNDLYNKLRQNETGILIKVFMLGKESGIFQFDDASELANLFSDILQGIRIMKLRNITNLEMTAEDDVQLMKLLRATTTIFINSMKYNKIAETSN